LLPNSRLSPLTLVPISCAIPCAACCAPCGRNS